MRHHERVERAQLLAGAAHQGIGRRRILQISRDELNPAFQRPQLVREQIRVVGLPLHP
jgi:hypothetical protein